jgi:hypothetical protein
MIILSNHGILQSQQATVSAESILVGGGFFNYGSYIKRNAYSLNTDGTVNTTFDVQYGFNVTSMGTAGSKAIVQDSDGNFYIGGTFTTYRNSTATRIIKLFADGSVDSSFNVGPTGFNNTINAISINSAGKIYVGGNFTTFQGNTANRIIRLNTHVSKDTGFDNTTGFNGNVLTLAIDSSDKVYVGGSFTTYKSVTNNRIIRLNTDGSKDTGFDNATGFTTGQVTNIYLDSSGKPVVVGTFNTYKTTSVYGLCRLLTTGFPDPTFTATGLGGFTVGSPVCLAFDSSGKMYVGGSFTTHNGVLNTNRIIKLNTDGTKDTSFNYGTGFINQVNGIVIDSSGKIYVAGAFTSYNGITSRYIIGLNSDGTQNTSFDTTGTGLWAGFDALVSSLLLSSSSKLYALGNFNSYQGNDVGIISLSTTGSKNTSFNNYKGFVNSAGFAVVRAIAKDSSGNVYIGGSFTSYNGTSANNIIKLFSDGSIDTSFNYGTGFNNSVRAIVINSDGKIYAAGGFTTYNSSAAVGIVRIMTDGQKDVSFPVNTGFNFDVYSLLLDPAGGIYCSGGFTTYKGSNATRIIKLDNNASIDPSFTYAGTTFGDGVLYNMVLDSAGKIYVVGSFTLYRGATNNGIIKLNADNTKDTSFDNTTGFSVGSPPTTISLDSAGKLYVGGNFNTYKGVSAPKIIKLNTDGTKDTSFDNTTGFNDNVNWVFVDTSDNIWVCGGFVTYKGVNYGGVIKLLPSGFADASFTPTVAGFGTSIVNSSQVIIKLT